jgi:hypothetical protein
MLCLLSRRSNKDVFASLHDCGCCSNATSECPLSGGYQGEAASGTPESKLAPFGYNAGNSGSVVAGIAPRCTKTEAAIDNRRVPSSAPAPSRAAPPGASAASEAWAGLTMESVTNRGSAEAAALSKSPVREQRRQEHDSGSNKQKLFHGAPFSSVLSREPYYTNPDGQSDPLAHRRARSRSPF